MATLNRILAAALLGAACLAAPSRAQLVSESAQGVNVNLVDTELRAAVAVLSQYLDRPVMYGQLGNQRITFVSPRPLARADIPGLLRTLLADNGYVMEDSEGGYRIRERDVAAPAAGPPQPGMAPGQPGFGAPPGTQPGPSLASAGGVELFVIRLRHARAADVAATLNALYGRASALGEIGQRRGTLGDDLAQNRIPQHGTPSPTATAGPGGIPGSVSGELVIVPDYRTNSLLVRANRADFGLIRAAVDQVDVRPLQVVIETTVAYVRRDYTFALGLDVDAPDSPLEESQNTTIGGSTRSGVEVADLVIRALNLGGIDLDVVLRAGESRSNVLILDRPLLLAANNEEAEIVVGEQRPFVQVQRSTDGGVLDEVVQYKDVGTTLRVLPTISADGWVQMQVVQEVNGVSASASGLDAPVINTRSVSTQLLVRDGHTAVLGGLSGTQRDRTSGGVPLLSSIPVLGAIFGSKTRRSDDFELFIFITPHVISSDEDLEDATSDVQRGSRAGRAADRRPPLVGREGERETPAAPGEATRGQPLPDAPVRQLSVPPVPDRR
jgi:type II secretory pathway component GspD/PulD (secretin)